MIDNETARKEVKLLKALNDVTYQEFGKQIGLVGKQSIYDWLKGRFNFSPDRLATVDKVIANLKAEND